jgi:transposase
VPILADHLDAVIGVDTHTDTHSASLLSPLGVELAALTVPATSKGYAQLLDFALAHAPGPRLAWAIEGTRSHGVGLTRVLHQAGQQVIEAGRPRRASARITGKSDPLDAQHAARTALATTCHRIPRADGIREALRTLLVTRGTTRSARVAAVNTFKALILTAEEPLRAKLRDATTFQQLRRAAALRVPAGSMAQARVHIEQIRCLARRVIEYDRELCENERQLRELVTALMPVLLEQPGVGAITAAQLLVSWSHSGRCRSKAAFARLAGVAPLEASSGRVVRHRLSRHGDRQLNKALHTIALVRLRSHSVTCAYAARRRVEGKSDREIRRCVKRALARSLFRLMERNADALDKT